MFYLTKRIDEKQCTPTEMCMVLSDFSGVPAGTKGLVSEIYDEGVMIAWIGLGPWPKSIEDIKGAIESGRCYPAAGFGTDGFSRDELQYLAFGTKAHPEVNPEVFRA